MSEENHSNIQLSPQALEYQAMLARLKEQLAGEVTIEDLRRTGSAYRDLCAPLVDVEVREVDAHGVRALWVEPAGATNAVLVYFHGGGYVMCSADTHVGIAGHLSARLGTRALVVDYRLAPEHRHPAAVEDCLCAYQWLLGTGVDPARIVFAGDSAGGALAISTQLLAAERALPGPAAAAVMSPWTDLLATGDSVDANRDTDFAGTREGQDIFARLFVGPDGDRSDPLASPLYADLKGLAPLYVQVGSPEILRDDAVRLVERARTAGVEAELDVVPMMQHQFQMWVGNMPEADAAVDRVAAFLRTALGAFR